MNYIEKYDVPFYNREALNRYSPYRTFSVIVLPDSQRYVEDGYRDDRLFCFRSQVEWILENKEKMNIRFVCHVGDIVHHRDSETERKAFFETINLLCGNVPFGFCAGNHDILLGDKAEQIVYGRNKEVDLSTYCQPSVQAIQDSYISQQRKKDYWVDDINNGMSSAQIFEACGQSYLVLHIEFGPSDATLCWARNLAMQNHTSQVILCTHMFLTPEEPWGITRRESRLSTLQSNMIGMGDNAGVDILEKLIKPCENIKWVVCGHYSDECRQVIDLPGRHVCAMQSDYELDMPYYGNGWLRILTFSPDEHCMNVRTYSPVLDAWRLRDKSHFKMVW